MLIKTQTGGRILHTYPNDPMKILKMLKEEILESLNFELQENGEYCKSIGGTVLYCERNLGGYWSCKVISNQHIQYNKIVKVADLQEFIKYTCSTENESANVIKSMEEFLN